LFSDLPNHPKYKPIFKLSQLPKSFVASVTGWLLPTDIPINNRF
jgi:hypothetical protein